MFRYFIGSVVSDPGLPFQRSERGPHAATERPPLGTVRVESMRSKLPENLSGDRTDMLHDVTPERKDAGS